MLSLHCTIIKNTKITLLQSSIKFFVRWLLGEWWDANPIDVLRQATRTGAAPNVSDAYTFNGQPGDLYKCSSKGKFSYFEIVPIFFMIYFSSFK